ncbi:MAG TPA: nuclear transport factor 2 family protein [Bryobacteraceae bacterium]|nr:nuclear transport factor 2 family protein [Bryobacteraceae bacterium]
MTKFFGVFLLVAACFSPVYGQATKPAASGTAEAVKQLERDWSEAQKARDIDKLTQILADDWSGLGSDGARSTKKQFLDDVKSGVNKLESFEIGPMDVKVIGSIAVVQGSDTEKSSNKGKDTSGKWVWMDVFVNRDGKWQAVRSQSAMVK